MNWPVGFFRVCCWLYNIISMLGQSFVTSWILDVCYWLYNIIISMSGQGLYRQAEILLRLLQTGFLVVVLWSVLPSHVKRHQRSKFNQSRCLYQHKVKCNWKVSNQPSNMNEKKTWESACQAVGSYYLIYSDAVR